MNRRMKVFACIALGLLALASAAYFVRANDKMTWRGESHSVLRTIDVG